MIRPDDRRDCGNCKDDGRPHKGKMYPIVVSGMEADGTMRMAWECKCGSHLPAEAVPVSVPTPEELMMARRMNVVTTAREWMQVVGEDHIRTAFERN